MPRRQSLYRLAIGYAMGVASTVLVGVIVFAVNGSTTETPTLHQDFTGDSAGTVDRADSGQLFRYNSNGTPGADLRVDDGRLTNTADSDAPAAGYVSVDLGQPVTRLSGTYQFSEGTSRNGAVGFLVRTDLPPPMPVGPFVLTSPCHLAVNREKFDFGVANDGKIELVATEHFDPPLEFNKQYTTSIELDYTNGIARIDGPDGRTFVYRDPRITMNRGSIGSFEVYQQQASADDRGSFSSISAS
jgi:hypothetical protein